MENAPTENIMQYIAIAISLLSLLLSAAALYVVNFWRGKIRCSKPIQFIFGYANSDKSAANVMIQCFMHSTGIVGQVIDHIFIEIEQGETKQKFTSWSAGQHSSNRIQLAGFKLPRDGHSIDFIFFTPRNSTGYKFKSGTLSIKMFYRLSGEKNHRHLFEEKFLLTAELVNSIENLNIAVFELGSTGEDYHSFPGVYQTPLQVENMEMVKEK